MFVSLNCPSALSLCRKTVFLLAGAAVVAGSLLSAPASAADPEKNGTETFQRVLEKQSRAMFNAVASYVQKNPQADDVNQAYEWLFDNAVNLEIEVEALPLTEKFLQGTKFDVSNIDLKLRAEKLRGLAMMKLGRGEEAYEILENQLSATPFRATETSLEFALALATQGQLEGDLETTRRVYERLAESNQIGPQIRAYAMSRLDRLDFAGKPAPAVNAKDIEGKQVDLADYRGKVVLIDFWATWCGPCLAELPNLQQIYKDYHDQGFEVIAISLDDDAETVRDFQKRRDLPWRMVMDTDGAGGDLTEVYNVSGIPAFFLVDQTGKIVNVDLRGDDLRKAVKRLVTSPAAGKKVSATDR